MPTSKHSEKPMSEAPLMNDEAARSQTGEILDQSQTTPPATTSTPTTTDESTTTATSPTSSATTSSEQPPKAPEAKPPTESQAAPPAYTDFTLPEGVTLSKETLDAATPIFRELGLSQEAAQRLVSFHADQLKAVTASAQEASYSAMRADWAAKTLADADIRGYALDGRTGIDAVKIDIGRALGTLDSGLRAEFQAAMDLTGAGDHPAFVKTLWQLSRAVAEGRPVTGKGPSPHGQAAPGARPPSAAQALYPNLPSAG